MAKIAMIFPYAPSYREAIYRLMDKELDVDWYFAQDCRPSLRLLDYPILKNVNLSLSELRKGPFSTLRGVGSIPMEKYDAVIVPGVFRCLSDVLLMWRQKKRSKTGRFPKLYLWTHGWYGKETRMERFIKKTLYPRVDGIFLYGNHARELMIKEGFDAQKLHVIYNCLDYHRHLELRKELHDGDMFKRKFGNDFPTLIFLGRLTTVKRLDMVMEAVGILRSRGDNFNVVFVGDGPARSRLEECASRLGLQDNVWFVGESFDEKRNAEMLYAADLCVSPGNVGLTSVHALTFGCPVVTNDDFTHQMPEFEAVQEGLTGDFFKGGSSESLADTIRRWIKTHEGKRDDVRQACYKEIDCHWTPDAQLKVLQKVLSE